MIDLKNPILLGPVQNQEHHMNGVVARRNNFNEPILGFLEAAYADFGRLTGRHYGLLTQYRTEDADTVFVSLGCGAENIDAACDYLRGQRNARVGSIHVNVIRPFPEAAVIEALRGKQRVIILERTDEGLAGDNPLARDIRVALGKANEAGKFGGRSGPDPGRDAAPVPRRLRDRFARLPARAHPRAYEYAAGQTRRKDYHRSAIKYFVEHRLGRAGPEQGSQGPEWRIITYPNRRMRRRFTQYSRISGVKRARRLFRQADQLECWGD